MKLCYLAGISAARRSAARATILAAMLWLGNLLTAPVHAALVNTQADIVHWAGSGANQAALVIDWADGQAPLAWGFRFDAARASDMLRAVVESDPRLHAKVEAYSFGHFVHGLGYDRNSNGFSITSGTNFGSTGFVFSGQRQGALASDPQDAYRETDADFLLTWGLWTATGQNYPGAAWLEGQVGISDLALSDTSWIGFRFNSPNIAPGAAVAAVPEPGGAMALLALGGALGLSGRRARRRRD